jgi:hypothetical protein
METVKEEVMVKNEMTICVDCKIEIPEGDEKKNDNGDSVCQECFDNNYSVCTDCNEVVHNDNSTYTTSHGNNICEGCYDSYYFTCSDCVDIVHQDYRHSNGDSYICEHCFNDHYFSCDNCSNNHHIDNCYELNGSNYCRECYDQRGTECSECGHSYNLEDMNCDEENNSYVCDACHNSCIRSARYKPKYHYYSTPIDDKLFIGIELEIESSNSLNALAEEVIEKGVGMFYCKNDGSLQHGFEIVSHPRTLEHWRKNKTIMEQIITHLKQNKTTSYDNKRCGLHIHLNRKCIADSDIYKMHRFFNVNSTQIYKFSRRTKEQISRWCNIVPYKSKVSAIKDGYYDFPRGNKYLAVNSCHSSTVEIRIFRGTLNYNRLYACLQFCHSIVYFVKEYSISSIEYNSWDKYIDYLKRHQEYNHLLTFLKGVKLCVC